MAAIVAISCHYAEYHRRLGAVKWLDAIVWAATVIGLKPVSFTLRTDNGDTRADADQDSPHLRGEGRLTRSERAREDNPHLRGEGTS